MTGKKPGMEKKKDEYEMDVLEKAKGMRVLLIDHDVASLMHTTYILEQATYKVTSTAIPDVALSMMQEQENEYDLVMAAVKMRGMDCISFLRLAKMVSNIPIALMSYKEDLQIAIRSVQRGACQYFVKPISLNDIRDLWQCTVRNERNKPGNEVIVNVEKPTDQKEKELIIVDRCEGKETQKRKRSEDENIEEEGKEKKKGRNGKKRVKWDAELHAKFMKMLRTDSAKGNAGFRMQASGTLDVTNLRQAAGQPQVQFTSYNSKEQLYHPSDLNRRAETSKQQLQMRSSQGVESSSSARRNDNAGHVVQTREANLRIQSHSIARASPVSTASSGALTIADFGDQRSAGRGGYTNHTPPGIGSVNLGAGTFNNRRFGVLEFSNNNFNIFPSGGTLTERVEQIRREYRTNNQSAITAKVTTASKTHDSMGNRAIESTMISGAKRNRFQYENAVIFRGETTLDNFGHIGSNSSSMNFGIHPLLTVPQPNSDPNPIAVQLSGILPDYGPSLTQNTSNIQTKSSEKYAPWGWTETTLPNPTYYAGQFSCTPLQNYASMFMQNAPQTEPHTRVDAPNHSIATNGLLASRELPLENPGTNWQMESNELFQALNHPIWNTNNHGLSGLREMQTCTSGTNQKLDVMHGTPSQVGPVYQAEKPSNDFVSINSTEGFLTSAQENNSQKTATDGDALLDELFAELRPHFVDDERRNSLLNINNVM